MKLLKIIALFALVSTAMSLGNYNWVGEFQRVCTGVTQDWMCKNKIARAYRCVHREEVGSEFVQGDRGCIGDLGSLKAIS